MDQLQIPTITKPVLNREQVCDHVPNRGNFSEFPENESANSLTKYAQSIIPAGCISMIGAAAVQIAQLANETAPKSENDWRTMIHDVFNSAETALSNSIFNATARKNMPVGGNITPPPPPTQETLEQDPVKAKPKANRKPKTKRPAEEQSGEPDVQPETKKNKVEDENGAEPEAEPEAEQTPQKTKPKSKPRVKKTKIDPDATKAEEVGEEVSEEAKAKAVIAAATAECKKLKMPIPFEPSRINPNLCGAIQNNFGLFTQCYNKRDASEPYCPKCSFSADNCSNKKPVHGTVQDRIDTFDSINGGTFRTSKGIRPTPWVTVLTNRKIPLEQAKEIVRNMGIEISECHWEIPPPVVRSGRPKKTNSKIMTIPSDTDDSSDNESGSGSTNNDQDQDICAQIEHFGDIEHPMKPVKPVRTVGDVVGTINTGETVYGIDNKHQLILNGTPVGLFDTVTKQGTLFEDDSDSDSNSNSDSGSDSDSDSDNE